MGWLVLGGFVALFLTVLGFRWANGRRQAGYFAVAEFWVYSNAEKLPLTPVLMDHVIGRNPHNKPGRPCITSREGVLFSDIRLHLGLAKREKNPHVFRPDLFESDAVPDAQILERLSESTTIAKVRYASQEKLPDRRHLQFLTHLADAMARAVGGQIVFDTVTERFWLVEELAQELETNPNAERADLHLRTVWRTTPEGHVGATLGLRKVGRRELETLLQEADHEVIVRELLELAAGILFRDPEAKLPLTVKLHDDEFVVEPVKVSEGRSVVKLTRRVTPR